MLKKLVVGVSALVLAGGAFMTAQALSTDGQRLPQIGSPLTVQPHADRTPGQTQSTPTSTTTTSGADDCRGVQRGAVIDRHGRGPSDDRPRGCDHLQTVIPNPSVFTDDHGGQDETEPGNEHSGQSSSGSSDDHSGRG